MVEWKVSEITKQEAALRQLDQAIRAFFRNDDMLAVHTLAAAATEVLSDLGKIRGVISPLRDPERIRPERQKEWLAALRKTQNFLKHADTDPDRSHTYNEEETVFLLFEAVGLAGALVNETGRERHAFFVWFVMSYVDLFEAKYTKILLGGAERHGVDATNRDQWDKYLNQAEYRTRGR